MVSLVDWLGLAAIVVILFAPVFFLGFYMILEAIKAVWGPSRLDENPLSASEDHAPTLQIQRGENRASSDTEKRRAA
jgi:hypothetical protein